MTTIPNYNNLLTVQEIVPCTAQEPIIVKKNHIFNMI